MKQCPDCLCYYLAHHTCPTWMEEMVAQLTKKKGIPMTPTTNTKCTCPSGSTGEVNCPVHGYKTTDTEKRLHAILQETIADTVRYENGGCEASLKKGLDVAETRLTELVSSEHQALLDQLKKLIVSMKVKDIREFDNSDYKEWGQTYTDLLIERKRWHNQALDDILALLKEKGN